MQNFTIDVFFTLFEKNKQLYIFLNNGNVHRVSMSQVSSSPETVTNKKLQENILILNRDKNTVQTIQINELNMHVPLNELLEKKGTSIF
jgi:hypothetical protein